METIPIIPDSIKLVNRKTVVGFSPREKDKYYDKVVFDILNANPSGVSAAEIEKATGFYGRTVREHLRGIAKLGKAFDVTRGGVTFYFPIGESSDKPLTIPSKTREGVFYVANKLTNQRGNFIYIQQKEMDDYRTLVVKGGIMIAEDDVKDFITKMHTYCAGK